MYSSPQSEPSSGYSSEADTDSGRSKRFNLNFLKKKRSRSRDVKAPSTDYLPLDGEQSPPPVPPVPKYPLNAVAPWNAYHQTPSSSSSSEESGDYIVIAGNHNLYDDLTPTANRIPRGPIRRASDNDAKIIPLATLHRSVQSYEDLSRVAAMDRARSQSSLGILRPVTPIEHARSLDSVMSNQLQSQSLSPAAIAAGATAVVVADRSLGDSPRESTSSNLRDAWSIIKEQPKQSTAIKILEKIGNQVTVGQQDLAEVQAVITAAGAPLQQIESAVEGFLEGSEVLMKALDDVAKLHPFIGVAVLAFKAVWSLEMKRRQNDKRVLALYGEMKDMMSVLVQLKNVKDPQEIAPDGTTIKGRMQELSQSTADDIKACANACDTYTKKKLVVKVLKGPIWEGKLAGFAGTFTKRRSEFEFALAIHTAVGIDVANQTLGNVDKTVQEMNAKIEMMTQMFQKLMLPEQRDMAKMIERRGGAEACMNNDEILAQLSGSDSGNAVAIAGKSTTKSVDIVDLRQDLHTDPEAAIEKNATAFNRKFEVQKQQIVDEVSKVVHREGDRIISAITGGPHERIIDPDVHKFWQEMGWRGSVKVRHFVLTLRDYYQEKWDKASHQRLASDTGDEWALSYVSILRVQPISEAFDDNASGYVSIQEANDFTSSRPIDWSLPQWIAFWSTGWHQSMVMYVAKIRTLMSKMFAVLPKVKQINQSYANEYLNSVYTGVVTLCDGVADCIINDALQEKFQKYLKDEEARLQRHLDAVDYDIDADQTLKLVTGEGRFEKFVLPLIYLLLKRHFDIFRVAERHIIHSDELYDAADTMHWVFRAAKDRVETLQIIFQQQNLDLKQQFKTFAHGLFDYINNPCGRWDPKVVQAGDPPEYAYDESLEPQDIDVKKVLNYPLVEELNDFAAYHVKPKPVLLPSARLSYKKMLGQWNGFHYQTASSLFPIEGMVSMELVADGQNQSFKASSRSNGVDFTVSGTCSLSETSNAINFTLTMTFPHLHISRKLKGAWNPASDSLTGSWWDTKETKSRKGVFTYKRLAPENLCFYPAPTLLKANRPRALWHFALHAVCDQIHRRDLTWTFFRERGIRRRRFIELYIRKTRFGRPLDEAEMEELRRIQKSLTNADHLFYISLVNQEIRRTVVHAENCEACGGSIGGARLSCLTCQMQEKFDTIDFCENPGCVSQSIVRDHLLHPHLPSHDLVKFRRVVHIMYLGKAYRDAKDALQRARALFAGAPITVHQRKHVDDEDSDDSHSGPSSGCNTPNRTHLTCSGCAQEVSQPCWYCVHCSNPTFICFSCETKKIRIPGHSIDTHDIVRCQEVVKEAKLTVEDRLINMEQRLEQFENTVNDRLHRMEKLLERNSQEFQTWISQLSEALALVKRQ